MDVAKERSLEANDILVHGLQPVNPMIDGNAATKAKYTLMAELEAKLTVEECILEPVSQLKTTVLIGFML